MADRPIIFSAPMVLALLEGRKTQTRRVLGRHGEGRGRYNIFNADPAWSDSYVLDPGNAEWRERDTPWKVGDRLWVREAWAAGACAGDMPPSHLAPRFWRVENGGLWYRAGGEPAHPITPRGKWRSPIHMPRWASRLTLTVTDVRVQRLQEISEEDALAEGVERTRFPERGDWGWPQERFRTLWERIHGPGAWEANPWVAAISFTVERRGL